MRLSVSAVLLFVALVALVALVACSSSSSPPGASTGLPCDVAAVLEKNCQTCHSANPQYGAPMALVTPADVSAVASRIKARIHDDAAPMPQAPNPRLSAAELAALDAYLAAGSPPSSASCAATTVSTRTALSCAPDLHIRPTAPYVMPAEASDLLVCYGFESTADVKRHITALAPAISATRNLHHVTLLQADREVSGVPAACAPEAMTSWRPLYGWAPGTAALELPKEAGFVDEPGSHFVVQLHFVNPDHVSVSDTSGFDLCTTSALRANDADVMAFGSMQITVPARGALDLDCSVPVPANGATTHLFAAFPHMHQLGRTISSVVRRGGTGAPVDLGTVTHFDLGEQTWLPIDYLLAPGDVVETKCSWTNPTDHGVGYGPTADDEMCFSYVMYYPKIADPWNWSLPALYSNCH